MIQQTVISSLGNYANPDQCEFLWNEIEQAYSNDDRHYHTLAHLNHLLKELIPFQSHFENWDTIIMAIAYHDIIYQVTQTDNEKSSADLASVRLQSISFPKEGIERCRRFIIATEKHEGNDREIDLFIDADLSILGAVPEVYQQYAVQIRNEYRVFPDVVYHEGRKKVLARFLDRPRIFKTMEFFDKYEQQARINLRDEALELGRHIF